MPENPIAAEAKALVATEPGLSFDEAVGRVVAGKPSERVLEAVEGQSPYGESTPFAIASQIPLFKAGMLGTAVEIWSSYEDGYAPTRLESEPGQPVIVRVVDDEIEDQLLFAGGYICGYIEGIGGDLDKLHIWLQPYVDEQNPLMTH